jgi:hypothetical protein
MFYRLVLLGVVLFAAGTVLGREWSDSTGKFHVEAELQAVEGDTAVLAKADGSTLRVPLDRLSDCDSRFARTLFSRVSLELANGHSLPCTILQTNPTQYTILNGFMVLRMPRSELVGIKELDSKPATTAVSPHRLAGFRTIVVATTAQPWATDFQQIPATVIDNGVLRNIPYKSFRAGRDYEINIYGDPDTPAGFEIGVHDSLLNDASAKQNCVVFICGLLHEPADRASVHGLFLEKDKKLRDGLTFEVTPPSDPDAYGGWWVSVYNEGTLASVRATDAEMQAITVSRSAVSRRTSGAGSPESRGDWSSDDLRYARPRRKHQTADNSYSSGIPNYAVSSGGGSVYVGGYCRSNGTYVNSYTRSASRR